MQLLARRSASSISAEADSSRARVRVVTMQLDKKWSSRLALCLSMQCGPIRPVEPVEARGFSEISRSVQRMAGSRRRQLRTISRKGAGRLRGAGGSAWPVHSQMGRRWVSTSTIVITSDQTSPAVEGPVGANSERSYGLDFSPSRPLARGERRLRQSRASVGR